MVWCTPLVDLTRNDPKENGEPIQHIFCWSVDWWFGLLWRFGIACL